ncbi:MAG: hypothetical protein C4576_03900 [Desulfobacteraceae bacterium]|nr:MAG: hypothetical protein C4576_03900 [Desulfobacteraceae bacterium]
MIRPRLQDPAFGERAAEAYIVDCWGVGKNLRPKPMGKRKTSLHEKPEADSAQERKIRVLTQGAASSTRGIADAVAP